MKGDNKSKKTNKMLEGIIDQEEAQELAEFLKIFGDATRIRIISLLVKKSNLCVSDMCNLLNITQSALSHQLKILRDAKLVKYIKEGQMIYYEISDSHIKEIYLKGKEHVNEK